MKTLACSLIALAALSSTAVYAGDTIKYDAFGGLVQNSGISYGLGLIRYCDNGSAAPGGVACPGVGDNYPYDNGALNTDKWRAMYWGVAGVNPEEDPFDGGLSGIGLTGFIGETIDLTNIQSQYIYGMVTHYNRDITYESSNPYQPQNAMGIDVNVSWNLVIYDPVAGYDPANPAGTALYYLHTDSSLFEWETNNLYTTAPGNCPRNNTAYTNWPDIVRNGHTFVADGNQTATYGCDDAFSYTTAQELTDQFEYENRVCTVTVKPGFYNMDGICEEIGQATFWSKEFADNSACVVFTIGCEQEGAEGCTPGYWRQYPVSRDQVMHNWPAAYSPTDKYDVVFGLATDTTDGYCSDVNKKVGIISCPADLSLGEAIWMRGNDESVQALLRHSVAALLNAAADVHFPYSEGEVKDMVQCAFNESCPDWTTGDLAGVLKTANEGEEGCPLGNDGTREEEEPVMVSTTTK